MNWRVGRTRPIVAVTTIAEVNLTLSRRTQMVLGCNCSMFNGQHLALYVGGMYVMQNLLVGISTNTNVSISSYIDFHCLTI